MNGMYVNRLQRQLLSHINESSVLLDLFAIVNVVRDMNVNILGEYSSCVEQCDDLLNQVEFM